MANTTGTDRLQVTPWTTDRLGKTPFAIPASGTTTFYTAQFIGRDASGNLVQADDTAAYEFVGVTMDIIRVDVSSTDSVQTNGVLGDKMGVYDRPYSYIAKIASAAAGDEGKKVYIKFNNEVQYTCGTFGNYAGTVLRVVDSTHVEILAPWCAGILVGGQKGNVVLADAAKVLTKFDVNKTFQMPTSAARQITLPAVASTSPGDRITVINTGGANAITLKGNASENINGSNTLALTAAANAVATVESDGTAWWKVG